MKVSKVSLRELKAQIVAEERLHHSRDLAGRRNFNAELRQLGGGGVYV